MSDSPQPLTGNYNSHNSSMMNVPNHIKAASRILEKGGYGGEFSRREPDLGPQFLSISANDREHTPAIREKTQRSTRGITEESKDKMEKKRKHQNEEDPELMLSASPNNQSPSDAIPTGVSNDKMKNLLKKISSRLGSYSYGSKLANTAVTSVNSLLMSGTFDERHFDGIAKLIHTVAEFVFIEESDRAKRDLKDISREVRSTNKSYESLSSNFSSYHTTLSDGLSEIRLILESLDDKSSKVRQDKPKTTFISSADFSKILRGISVNKEGDVLSTEHRDYLSTSLRASQRLDILHKLADATYAQRAGMLTSAIRKA